MVSGGLGELGMRCLKADWGTEIAAVGMNILETEGVGHRTSEITNSMESLKAVIKR